MNTSKLKSHFKISNKSQSKVKESQVKSQNLANNAANDGNDNREECSRYFRILGQSLPVLGDMART